MRLIDADAYEFPGDLVDEPIIEVEDWVSVEEKLPELMRAVLVCTKFDDIYIAWYLGNNDWRSCEGNIQNITHWMPLPNLPERN